MGLSDRCAGALPRADALCRAIVCECARRHFRGVLADFFRALRRDGAGPEKI